MITSSLGSSCTKPFQTFLAGKEFKDASRASAEYSIRARQTTGKHLWHFAEFDQFCYLDSSFVLCSNAQLLLPSSWESRDVLLVLWNFPWSTYAAFTSFVQTLCCFTDGHLKRLAGQ